MTEDTASTSELLNVLAKIEAAADDVLVDRAQIVELDKKRQENRMAEKQLKPRLNKEEKTWMCFGNTFVKLPSTKVHSFLESNQKAIDKEINRLRDSLKEKVNILQDLEGKAPLNRGYFLTPLSHEETANVLPTNDDV